MGKTDATQKDPATKDGAGQDVSTENFGDERENAFDSIVAKREKAREDGTLDSDMGAQYLDEIPDEEEPEKKAEAKPAEDDKTPPAETPPAETPPAAKDDDEEMVEITVYGEKKLVLKSKALEEGIRAMQKESAADLKLAKADEILNEVKALRDEFGKPTKEIPPESDATKGKSNADLIYAIRYGEDDEAEEAIEALKGRGQSFKPEEIDQLIDQRIAAKSGADIVGRLQKPVTEGGYSDIMANPRLMQYAGLKVEELVEAGEGSRDSYETYQKACEWVRTAILGQTPTTPASQDNEDPVKKKEQDKEKITQISTATDTSAAESKQKTDTPADPDTDRRAAIKQMQKDRQAGRY